MNTLENYVKELRRAYNILKRAKIFCERNPSQDTRDRVEFCQARYEAAYENVIDALAELKRP